MVVAAAASLWLDRRQLTHSQRFAQLLERTMSSLQAECTGAQAETDAPDPGDAGAGPRDRTAVTPARLRVVDARRRALLEARAPGLMDALLGRYCRHYLLRNPYTEVGSLLVYVGRLALSVAAIRLMWTASPDLAAGFERPADRAVDRRDAEKVAVEVTQTFTKAISHHVDYMNAIHASHEHVTDHAGGITFGRLVLFAKFV